MKTTKSTAIGKIATSLKTPRKPLDMKMPEADGKGPEDNPSARGMNGGKKKGSKPKRNIGRR